MLLFEKVVYSEDQSSLANSSGIRCLMCKIFYPESQFNIDKHQTSYDPSIRFDRHNNRNLEN